MRSASLSLIIRVDARSCALPLGSIEEVTPSLEVRPAPDAPRFVAGLSRVRGAPVPVVDLGALIEEGGETSPDRIRSWTRFVILKLPQGRLVALGVNEVTGVQEIEPSELLELPKLLRSSPRPLVEQLARLDDEFLMVLDTARIQSA